MRKYIFSLLGILLVVLSTFSFALQPEVSVWAEDDPPSVVEEKPIENQEGLWSKIKQGVQDIYFSISFEVHYRYSRFFPKYSLSSMYCWGSRNGC